jgi:hypothetical protein
MTPSQVAGMQIQRGQGRPLAGPALGPLHPLRDGRRVLRLVDPFCPALQVALVLTRCAQRMQQPIDSCHDLTSHLVQPSAATDWSPDWHMTTTCVGFDI